MKYLSTHLVLIASLFVLYAHGQFGPGVPITTQFSFPQDIKTADLDGDLDQDIVLRNNGALVWSRNDGQGIFGPVDTLYASNWPTSWYYWFDLSDIELDGDLDVVVLNVQDSLLLWLPNTGGASFAPAQVIADLHGHGALATMICSDIMGDPTPDVIVNEENMNKRMVYINDSGTFGTTDSIFGGMFGPMVPALVAGDIDLDGDRDMVVQHWSGQVLALLNSGGAGNSWTDTLMIASGGPFFINNGQNLQLLDVDANGDLDLADAASDNTPVWAENFAADSGGFRHFLPQWIGPGGGINGHAGWLAHLGCGDQASALWTSGPDRDTMRWSVFDAQLDAFAPPTYWASEPGIRLIRTADLNGDGAQDLILAHSDSLVTWYPNLLPQQPLGAVTLTPFDTLCVNGDPYPLQHAMPAGGTWTGAGVAANTYTPSLGTLDLTYTVADSATGCPMSAIQAITAIAEPTITLVSGDLADECYVTPVQFAASPTPGVWSAPADSTGLVDRSCAVRPLNGYASYAFLAVNGGNCSAEGTAFNLPGCLLLDLGPDQLLCVNADTLVIGVQGPALGYSGVGGAFDSTAFVPPNSSYGYFYPGHAPGAYALNAIIGGANECPGIDSLIVTVIPAPDPAITSPLLFCVTVVSGEIVVDMPGDFSGAASGTNTLVGTVYPSLLGLGTHAFSFTATDTNQCTTTLMENLTVDICDGTLDPAYAPGSFHLSPNPTSGTCLVRLYSSAPARITVLDASGRVVQELATATDAVLLDVARLDQGCYTVCVAQNGVQRTQRLVVY